MNLKSLAFKLFLLAHVILSVCPNVVWAEKILNILIVANSKEDPYQQAIAGFKEQLSKMQKANFTDLFLTEIKDQDKVLSSEIRDHKPDLIFSLGGEATEIAIHNTSTIPIVATIILKRFSFKEATNMTGVYLNYPLTTQFRWLKKFFEEQRKVAIFFNEKENSETIQEAKKIANQEGLDLIPIPVQTPKELPYALDQLKNNIEIIMAIPDDVAMSPKTAKEVLLASFRNRVPLIGLSDNWVKSGALYALSWDYDDLGRQCAIQSDKLTKGASIQSVPIEYPRKTTYSINTKIAEHLNMDISQALLKNAKLLFN